MNWRELGVFFSIFINFYVSSMPNTYTLSAVDFGPFRSRALFLGRMIDFAVGTSIRQYFPENMR